MAFISVKGVIKSFADFDDVKAKDTRVFDANEIINNAETVEDMLFRSTERLVQKLKASSQWQRYNGVMVSGGIIGFGVSIPDPVISKLLRKTDWTDLCVYHTLSEYLYPSIADFGDETSAEVQKIAFYRQKMEDLWQEILAVGDFYDKDGDGTVEQDEKMLSPQITRRSRGYRRVAGVR